MKKRRRLSWAEVHRIYVFVLKLGYNIHLIRRKQGDVIVLSNVQAECVEVYIKL